MIIKHLQTCLKKVTKSGKKGGDVGVAGIRSDDDKADTRIYSVQGVRVTRPSVPGVYIVNGRKYVVR